MELLHQMAYNSKRDCISIEEAKKDESYYYDYNLINEFVLRQGDKNRHHFALKSGSNIGGETDIHRDAKMWLVSTKELFYNGCVIKAYYTEYERATIKDSKRIPDVTFYDEQGNIICIIEVVNTNAISIEKEKELKERNILTFEAVIKDGSYKEFESIRYFGNEQIEGRRVESKEEINRIRFELQRKDDLLSREADEEVNAKLSDRYTNLREGIERKQHEVSLSENRIKSVGIKLEKAICLN